MAASSISLEFGRQAFGADAAGYYAVRPAYPDWVFEVLQDRCGLRQDAVTFEIGAGTGIATRRLLVLDPDQTVALYATYSNVNIRPDREAVLAELGRIVRIQFNGRVIRNMTTSLYIARRRE